MKCPLRPLGAKIIVERIKAEEMTPGGIVLPDTAKEKPKRGIIRSTGPGKLLDSGNRAQPEVKIGNEIVFTTYAGSEVKIGTNEFVIMDESDVLAIIE